MDQKHGFTFYYASVFGVVYLYHFLLLYVQILRSVFESEVATPTMNLFLIIRTGLATGFLIFALTFITNAVKSWNEAPSVTSSNIY